MSCCICLSPSELYPRVDEEDKMVYLFTYVRIIIHQCKKWAWNILCGAMQLLELQIEEGQSLWLSWAWVNSTKDFVENPLFKFACPIYSVYLLTYVVSLFFIMNSNSFLIKRKSFYLPYYVNLKGYTWEKIRATPFFL